MEEPNEDHYDPTLLIVSVILIALLVVLVLATGAYLLVQATVCHS